MQLIVLLCLDCHASAPLIYLDYLILLSNRSCYHNFSERGCSHAHFFCTYVLCKLLETTFFVIYQRLIFPENLFLCLNEHFQIGKILFFSKTMQGLFLNHITQFQSRQMLFRIICLLLKRILSLLSFV